MVGGQRNFKAAGKFWLYISFWKMTPLKLQLFSPAFGQSDM